MFYLIKNRYDDRSKNSISTVLFKTGYCSNHAFCSGRSLRMLGENAAWGNWDNFKKYTRELTFFLPENLSSFSAYSATFLEILFPLMLIFGYKTKIAAYGAGFLLLIFALSMTMALGIKAPFDYSVWIGSTGAFLLAGQLRFSLSIDQLIKNNI